MQPPPPPRADIPRATGSLKSRAPVLAAAALSAALGYYYYTANGDAKNSKHDASRMSSSVPDELAGSGKEAKKSAEETMAHVGSTVDHELNQGKQRASDSAEKIVESKDNAKQQVLGTIGLVDRKVEEEASKAKSGVLGWFRK